MKVFQLQSNSQLLAGSTSPMKIYDDEEDEVGYDDIL